ncbi:MAG TPA: tetratricopeptide repeat protein [Longimicrobium sp.]|nr:tetratricopeptide repeat protein [Longimicrobium sp.]
MEQRTAQLVVWAWSVSPARAVGRYKVGWRDLVRLARAAELRVSVGPTSGCLYLPHSSPDGGYSVTIERSLPPFARAFVLAMVIAAVREGTTVQDTAHEAFAWTVLRGDRNCRRRQLAELRCCLCAAWAEEQLPAVQVTARRAYLLACGVARSSSAYILARAYRRKGEPQEATTWYLRAAELGEAEGAYRRAALALVGLGGVRMAAGDLDGAETWYRRALDLASRYRSREASAWPLHDLLNLAVERGQHDDLDALSHQALEAYGPRHRNLLRLAGDVGYSYLKRGRYNDARPIFETVATLAGRPDVRSLAWAYTARCAAATDDSEAYRFAAAQVWRLHADAPDGILMAEALVELAAAAQQAGRGEDARSAGKLAAATALERQEPVVLLKAVYLLNGAAAAPRVTKEGGGEQFARRLVTLLRAA